MPSFSQRMGLAPDTQPLQLNEISVSLRDRLWNAVYTYMFCDLLRISSNVTCYYEELRVPATKRFFFRLWHEFFNLPIDEIPPISGSSVYGTSVLNSVKMFIRTSTWFEVYELLEFLAEQCSQVSQSGFVQFLNEQLEVENAGYRFVGAQLVPITNELELETIEQAITGPFETEKIHVQKALDHFSDKENPDYRNAVKEAISSVESACKVIAEKNSASLGDCLKVLKEKHPLHAAFEQALHKLYGYTSDEGGIRHSLTDDSVAVTADDAKFMIVLCCSFVNYLISLVARDGVKFGASA